MNEFEELNGEIIITGKGYVIEGFSEDNKLFYRTVGLKDVCNLELEINLSLEPYESKRILDYIYECIIWEGHVLEDGLVTSNLTGAPILVQKRKAKYPKYENEQCYRIIFSDENLLLPTDENCTEIYKHQLN